MAGRGRSRARRLSRTVRRSGGGRFPLLRLHQLTQLEVFFVSPGFAKSALVSMLFRVVLIIGLEVVFRWCAVPLSKVLSTERPTVVGSLGAPEATEPHGRGAGKQWTSPA